MVHGPLLGSMLAAAVVCNSLNPALLGIGKVGLCGEGGAFEPPKVGGGGSGKGALVTVQSQEASLKPRMMTHQLRRKAARKIFSSKKFPS